MQKINSSLAPPNFYICQSRHWGEEAFIIDQRHFSYLWFPTHNYSTPGGLLFIMKFVTGDVKI